MNDESKPSENIVLEYDLPHPPEKVWRALTDADLLAQWLKPSDLRPEVGARFRLSAQAGDHAPMIDCEVVEAVPHRTLRWRQVERVTTEPDSAVESIVTFELLPSLDGTHLRIVHDHFRRIEVQASDVNVIRFEPRATRVGFLCPHRPDIVCTLVTLRRAA